MCLVAGLFSSIIESVLAFLCAKKPKSYLIVVLLLFLALLTRIIFLDRIPFAFSHDEMGYVINAQSVSVTGKGKTGEWQPLSLSPVETYLSELPTIFITPFLHLPFNNVVNIRLLFVLLSLSLPFLLAEISWILTKSKKVAFFTLMIGLFNPWIWQNGRLTFDAIFSLWFYTLGIVFFLQTRNSFKLASLLAFFLGFYCYQGFKLLLPLIVLSLFIFTIFQKKIAVKTIKKTPQTWFYHLLFFVALLSMFAFYFFHQLPSQAASLKRIDNQLLLPNSTQIVSTVDHDRRLTITSFLSPFFINKYIQFAQELLGRVMLIFGWRELFFEINASSTSFAVWNHGRFYLLDSLLIVLGLLTLWKNKKHAILLFLLSMLAIGAIPALFTNDLWLFFRSAFIIPFLIIFAGIGLNQISEKNKKLFIIFIISYFILIINFTFNYFFRYPLFAAEGIFASPRILVSYLYRAPSDRQIVVFENEPEFLFTNYIFYNNLFTGAAASEIQQSYKNEKYVINNLIIQKCIPENLVMNENTTYIFDVDIDYCQTNINAKNTSLDFKPFVQLSSLQIKQIKDSGDNYIIYYDKLCSGFPELQSFLHPQTFNDLHLDSLNNRNFCQTWITRN